MSKKRKTSHVALNDLSWQPVVRAHAAGFDFDEGLLELEEVVGVQVEYQQTASGRVATFVVRFLSQSWAFGMCVSLICLRWTTRKTRRQLLRSRRVQRLPSHRERSPRQPSPSPGLSRLLIVGPTPSCKVYQTFKHMRPSEKITAGMALLLTSPATICGPLFTEVCKPDSNSVSNHSEGTQWARCHWYCRDRPFLGF